MKRNYIKSILACCGLALAATACTDVWEDHYQVNPELNGSENLWDLISTDPDLDQFEELLKATGYDTLLTKSRSYTVWAPVDGSGFITEAEIEALNTIDEIQKELYIKEIVQNHIADYSHLAGGIRDKENQKNYKMVEMLNGKAYHFTGSTPGAYKFSDNSLKEANKLATNGVLHKLNGYATFAANIWEQLAKSAKEDGIDSLYAFLYKDYKKEFNQYASVQGPIVDGKVTWLDSAWTISCRWFHEIGYMDLEDSLYTMYALTNQAWTEMYEQTKSYFAFPTDMVTLPARGSMSAERAADSIVKELMVRNLVFSNTVNKRFFDGETDTLISTRWQMFKGKEAYALGNNASKSYSLSNGTLNIVDRLESDEVDENGQKVRVYSPFTCWHDTIRIQGESLYNQSGQEDAPQYSLVNKSVEYVHRDSLLYDSISGGAIGIYTAPGTNKPVFNFYVNDVLSAYYRVKIVLLPPQIIEPLDTVFIKPNKFKATLWLGDGTNRPLGSFVSDSSRIDTIVLADCVKIPVCEYQLSGLSGRDAKTRLEIVDDIVFGNRGQVDNRGTTKNPKNWKYDNSYRIDQVLFEPVSAPTDEKGQ